jgi:hypothetical protein
MAPSWSLPPFSCDVEVNPAPDDCQCVSLANFAALHESGIGTLPPSPGRRTAAPPPKRTWCWNGAAPYSCVPMGTLASAAKKPCAPCSECRAGEQ